MRHIDNIKDLLSRYNAYLLLERGLSDNTREAYRNDILKLLQYLNDLSQPLRLVTLADLQAFVTELHDLGISPRSQSRIISGIKSFFKFLRLDGYIETDPTQLLESPKLGRHLPEILTVEEQESIAVFVALEVARILHVLAIFLSRVGIVLLIVVRIGELSLAEG